MRTPAPPSGPPCPDKIIHEAGIGFAAGIPGGTAYHFLNGARTSPRGHRLSGAIQTMRMNAPRTVARFGAWGALYGFFDCGLHYLRHKEDTWNSMASAAVTCGLFEVRRSVWRVAWSAASGAGLVALLEGGIVFGDRLMLLAHMSKETAVKYPEFSPSRDGAGGENKDEIGFDLRLGEGWTHILEGFDIAE